MYKDSVTQMSVGDIGVVSRIHSVRGAGKRLADMGFVQGARLEMVKPGRPCIVRVNECCIALGNDHQKVIELHVSEPRTHLVA